MRIRTILCPIDFSTISAPELAMAAEVARAFDARIVLHHGRMSIAPGLSRAWDWTVTHQGDVLTEHAAERRMQAALDSLPAGLAAEGVVSVGPIGTTVLALAEQMPADLIVLGSHGWTTPDHVSVTERVIEQAPCPVVTLRDGSRATLHLGSGEAVPANVVVPTDLGAGSRHAVDYAFALARTLPVRLELLHVVSAGRRRTAAAEQAVRERLDADVPPDLAPRVATHVRFGDPAAEIVAYVEESRPDFALVGQHARGVFRGLFTRDTARTVVHESRCPVWVVPARAAA